MKRYVAATIIAVGIHVLFFCSNINFVIPNGHSALEISGAECFDIIEPEISTSTQNKLRDATTNVAVSKEESLFSETTRKSAVEADISVKNEKDEIVGQATPPLKATSLKKPALQMNNSSGIATESTSIEKVVDIAPRRRYAPAPQYPLNARRKGWEGTAIFNIEVSSDGKISQIVLLKSSGFEILDRAALKALKQWYYYPAILKNQPVSSKIKVPIVFRLEQS